MVQLARDTVEGDKQWPSILGRGRGTRPASTRRRTGQPNEHPEGYAGVAYEAVLGRKRGDAARRWSTVCQYRCGRGIPGNAFSVGRTRLDSLAADCVDLASRVLYRYFLGSGGRRDAVDFRGIRKPNPRDFSCIVVLHSARFFQQTNTTHDWSTSISWGASCPSDLPWASAHLAFFCGLAVTDGRSDLLADSSFDSGTAGRLPLHARHHPPPRAATWTANHRAPAACDRDTPPRTTRPPGDMPPPPRRSVVIGQITLLALRCA